MIIKPAHRISTIKPYYFATKLAQIRQMNAEAHQSRMPEKLVLNLGVGSPDLPPPSAVISKLNQIANNQNAHGYQSYHGLLELRTAFAEYYKKLSVNLDDKEVLPLIGSKEGIMHISMAFLNPGDQVLIPNPGYPSYKTATEICGAHAINYDLYPENDWLPDLDQLEKLDLSKVKIMWINYPHMPTGATASKAFFTDLVAFAERRKILICHDNPYNHILHKKPLSILSVPNAKKSCIELVSLSKAWNMAGWRVGAVIGQSDYLAMILRFKSNMDSGMFKPIQLAAAVALSSDQKWHDNLNAIYTKRREMVWAIFDLLKCSYQKDSAGLFVWAKVPDIIADLEEWAERILQESRVFITPGFIFGTRGNRYLRISLCSSIDTLKKAHKRIQENIKSFSK